MTNSTQPSANNALQELIRKAEMQQLQLQLEVRFKRNMEAFKTLAPEIYEEFIDYQPEELRLEYTPEGYLNLVNYNLNNKPVYAEDPKTFTRRQFDDFCKEPTITSISFGKTNHPNKDYIHPRLINQLVDYFKDKRKKQKAHVKVPIGFMLVTGCGLGYHLETMVEELDIHHLCIYDPHKDSFYASLHTIDWLPILKKLCVKGKMLKFFLGVAPEDAMANMKLLSDKIGLFNLVYTFVYRHFKSVKEEAFIEMYRKEFHLAASGTGFFDDEQVSLAHTVLNINRNEKFFRHITVKGEMPTVFLLGNGPSLDQHIDYIKAHKDSAIVITCGTALSSLAKTGIKPDFHVEMERTAATPSFIEAGTTPEYRKDVPLLALNTAPPNMVELFEEVCLALKPNDLGTLVFNDFFPDQNIHTLALCNPTVTNAGLSFAFAMGFKKVILFGVDLGMKSEDQHHSSLSLYHEIERKTQKRNDKFKFKNGEYKIAGNFGEDVYTNPKLHNTKTNLEILIRHFDRHFHGIEVLNPNDGALISGTVPTQPEALPDLPAIEGKHELISTLKKQHFVSLEANQISETDIREKYLQFLFDLRPKLTISKTLNTPEELFTEMTRIFGEILKAKKQSPTSTLLIRGSINSLLTLLTQGLLFANDKYEFKKHYNDCRKVYMEMIKSCFQFIDEHPLQEDKTYVDVASILGKTASN